MFLLVSRYIVLSFLFLNPIYSETQDNQEGSLTPLLSGEIFRYQYAQNTNDHVIIDWAMLIDQVNNKNLVDGYIAGQEAIANSEVQTIHNLVGGADNYSRVIDYAKTNLNEAEQNAFNETLETGSIEQVKFAVQGIASRAGIGS